MSVGQFTCDSCFFSLSLYLPYICITCYSFEAILYTVLNFLLYFTHGISETWILLVFIFSWLWPQLYYLFHVFSIVNIYKTLNKLFKIAFHNLPLYASGWDVQRRVVVTYPVSQSIYSLLNNRGSLRESLVFSFCIFVFSISQVTSRFGDLQRDDIA